MRYISSYPAKNATVDEIQHLSTAGIQVGLVWEDYANAALNGASQGYRDASLSIPQATDLRIRPDRPIYYAVDFDIRDYAPNLPNTPVNARAKLGPVAGYFDSINTRHGMMPVGAYGGYWTIKRLFDANLITYGWQTYAWSGGQWDARAQLRQVQNNIVVSGAHVDRNESQSPDFGQWSYSTPVISPPPPEPVTDHAPGTRYLYLVTPYLSGSDVGYVQRFIGPSQCGPADGVFGPHTHSGVIWYQRMRGIAADGIVGPVTWSNMGIKWRG